MQIEGANAKPQYAYIDRITLVIQILSQRHIGTTPCYHLSFLIQHHILLTHWRFFFFITICFKKKHFTTYVCKKRENYCIKSFIEQQAPHFKLHGNERHQLNELECCWLILILMRYWKSILIWNKNFNIFNSFWRIPKTIYVVIHNYSKNVYPSVE